MSDISDACCDVVQHLTLAAVCRFLPEDTFIFGYARSKLSDDDLRKKIKPGIGEGQDQDEFLSKIKYIAGQYDGSEGYQQVRPKMSFHAQGFLQCMCKRDRDVVPRTTASVVARQGAANRIAWAQARIMHAPRSASAVQHLSGRLLGCPAGHGQLCCKHLSLTSHECFCR